MKYHKFCDGRREVGLSKTFGYLTLTCFNLLFAQGKKSLYIRLGCRGDWPDIKPPGWDPSNPDGAES